MTLALIIFVITALVFDFLNGFHDSANVVSTAIASRAVPPTAALVITACAEMIGPFLFGVAVASTVGSEVVQSEAMTVSVAMAALLSAITWNLLTWWLGIPSSSSHALMGGFMGAAIMGYGLGAIRLEGLVKVLIGLFVSPLIGFLMGWLVMKIFRYFGQWMSPRANVWFLRPQWVTMITLGLSHGSNDAQKTMGILTMGLVAFGVLDKFVVPTWVMLACAAAIGLGTLSGGWRLIRTMGGKFYRIRPMHALSSQISGTLVILTSGLLGAPVSTTQVISSTIVGAGSAERVQKVRWGVAGHILLTWGLTIPVTGVWGGLVYWVVNWLVG